MPIRVFSAVVALSLGLTLAATGAVAAPTSSARPTAAPASLTTEVAIVAPLTVPVGSGGLLDSATLADYTAPLGSLTRQLDAVEGQPVTVAIDPLVIASIRVLGASAPDSAREWLHRLSQIDNPTIALPYANSDPTLATQAGEATTLEPLSFEFALDAANFTAPEEADAVPSPAPSTTPTPSQLDLDIVPSYPSTSDVLAWDYSITDVLLPRRGTVTAADLQKFAASGYQTVVLSSDNVSQPEGAGPVAMIDGMQVLVADAAATDALHTAIGSTLDPDVVDADASLASAVRDVGSRQSAPTGSVLLVINHSLEMSAARLASALNALRAQAAVSIVSLPELAATPSGTATIIDLPHDDSRLKDTARLLAAADKERSFFVIADDPEALTASRRLALLDVLGTVPTDKPSEWLTSVNGFIAESRDIRSAVSVVESPHILFLADNSFLPVSVNNELNQPVTVVITVNPRTGLLAVADHSVELRIEANSQGTGNISAQSISNGLVDVEVRLSSTTGVSLGTPSVSEVNVQAGWETPVVLALAALVVIVFGVGFIRSVLQRKKPARGP